ncbi:MAG: AAA family ATPase, partial [Candidatus Poseidoniaceae archaeon]
EVKFTPVGHTDYGHTVLKSKVSKEYRAFCSIVNIKDVNKGKPHVYIHTICHTTDQNDVVNRCCDTLVEGTETTYDELEAENSPDYTALGAYAPVKPLPSVPEAEIEDFAVKITGPNNLNLDDEQKEALASNQPLLIDGLAGTGKTAVLAIRASLQLTHADPGRNVLVCASMGHVVEKLRTAIEELTYEGRRDDSIKMDSYGMGISAKGFGKSLKLDEFISTKPTDGFDEIILDECQDLTYTEFQLLLRLTKGKQARRFSIAGDPMQTLNPTGFDWGTIRAMFIEEMKNEFTESELREIVKESKFHRNYRSQSHLVKLNNGIQRHRARVTGVNGIIMKAGRPPLRFKPFLVCIDNHEDKELLHNILKASGKAENKAIIITWSTDDHDLERLLQEDEDLSPIWIEFKGEDYNSEKGVRSKFLIHSASSIKGDEHDAVILYKFLSNPDAREKLGSMMLPYGKLKRADDENRIAVAYAFSRLYVSLTRAFSHVVVVEDKAGYEFWKNTKLTILDGAGNLIEDQMFQPNSSLQAAVNALQDVFEQTREQTLENYHKYRQRWEDSGSLDALNTAINIGLKLLESEERDNAEFVRNLGELEGDIAWLNYLNAVTDLEKETYLEEALQKYQEAGLKEKIAPIRYEQRNWEECLKNLTGDSLFERWVQLRCRLELTPEIGTDVFGLKEPTTSPSDWALGLKQFIRETKALVFNFFFGTSFEQENDEIFENRGWFKKPLVLEQLSNHGKANKLITRLWDAYNRYDESTARIYAESIRKSIENQSSES